MVKQSLGVILSFYSENKAIFIKIMHPEFVDFSELLLVPISNRSIDFVIFSFWARAWQYMEADQRIGFSSIFVTKANACSWLQQLHPWSMQSRSD
jgi:hypothetical protein